MNFGLIPRSFAAALLIVLCTTGFCTGLSLLQQETTTLRSPPKSSSPPSLPLQTEPIMSAKKEECRRFYEKIQSMFPHVPMISSDEFVAMDNEKIVLVDVRSKPERDISVVSGAVPLADLDVSKLTPDSHVVLYCTVGFRACLEASKLQQENESLQVSCLDGIAGFSHTNGPRKIVDPLTGAPSQRIHTFGEKWNCVADQFQPVYFTPMMFSAYSMQFGVSMAWKTAKTKLIKFLG